MTLYFINDISIVGYLTFKKINFIKKIIACLGFLNCLSLPSKSPSPWEDFLKGVFPDNYYILLVFNRSSNQYSKEIPKECYADYDLHCIYIVLVDILDIFLVRHKKNVNLCSLGNFLGNKSSHFFCKSSFTKNFSFVAFIKDSPQGYKILICSNFY